MATLIVKITHGTEIRRFTSNSATLSWSVLSKRVGELFALSKYKLTYVDDEGDKITLSSEDEFTEAVSLALKTEPAVLRLGITVESEKKAACMQSDNVPMADASTEAAPRATADAGTNARPPTADAGTTNADGGATRDERDLRTFLNQLATQLPTVISQLPEGVRRLIPRAELDVAATLAANAVDNASCAAAAAARAGRDAWAASAANDNSTSNDSGNDDEGNIHPGVTCDRSGMCPIVGHRYNLVGHNYDLCEAEYNKLSEREKALYQRVPPPFVHRMGGGGAAASSGARAAVGVHPGIECDRSGMNPIIGTRYNLRGHNYDLCEAEFAKLAAAEKLLYTAIPPPLTGAAGVAAAAAGGGGGCHSWRQSWGGGGGRSWGGGGREGREGGPKLAARFVRDVTIFDGTQMAPSTKFTKIWRLKNIGEVAWPPGTKMLYVGGDQMTSEMSVPLSRAGPVLAGDEVDVAVEMVAPAELGRYLGYWRLVGPHGRRKFGQRVWCHVQVVDPAAPASLASTDEELKRALAEIEKKKEALAATDPDGHDDDEGSQAGTEAAASSTTPPSACSPSPAANKPCGRAGCAYAVTWHRTHCCNACANGKGHGGRCAKKALPKEPEAPAEPMAAEPAPATTVLVGEPVDAMAAGGAATAVGAAADAVDVADQQSDDGMVVVTEGMCLEPEPAKEADDADAAADALDKTTPEGVKAALGAMGFRDASMVQIVVEKHGADLDACARDLAAATEWDSLLDDLAEMGFEHRDLNRTLLLKHDGNVKRTVKALVEDA